MEYNQLGLSLSKTKTEFVVFTNKYKLPPFIVWLDGIEIKRTFEFKYMGVIFDHRCNWRAQTHHIMEKCEKRLNFMRTVSAST